MFYDQENCRAFRLLCEASSFLEASLEKLLALEQEALAERDRQIKNATDANLSDKSDRNQTSLNMNEKPTVNLNLETITDPADKDNICTCNSENKCKSCFVISQTIQLSTKSSPNELVNSAKRKYGSIVLKNDIFENSICENKKRKTELMECDTNQINSEINMNPEDDSSDTSSSTLTDSNLNQAQNHPNPQPSEITWLEEYFKVCIMFKESLEYETVQELLKSVGLEDVFDLVLTKKKAEVTFLSENSMKKALNLPQAALNKLKAYMIRPVT